VTNTSVSSANSGRQPSVVVICGSTRFRRQIAAANRGLTLAGHIVLAPGVFVHDDQASAEPISDEQKRQLDSLHLAKIDLASWVYVVNPGGYFGESTRREIAYAALLGKQVVFSDQVDAARGGGAT